ncbi:MAG TPA: protein kinase [Polyangiaceae bacterium]
MGRASPERVVTPFPEQIGRYELLLPIGTGGMATVFLGRMSGVGGFERDVAVKIIHAHLRADEESKSHLLEEARLSAGIRHPNVVPVLEVGDDPFGVYLVMDYVEGDTLAGLMRELKARGEKLPLSHVARILSDAIAGLHAAHELTGESGRTLGLVHRDFSPQNILVGMDGVSRLADFSVAKAGDRAVRTRTGLIKGKISYMSPEQARGHAVDRRCDVWAAGVVAWELIAWRRMHRAGDAVSTLLHIVTEEPPRLREVAPDVPKAVEDVVARALTMDPSQRMGSALEFGRELVSALQSVGPVATAEDVAELMKRVFGAELRARHERVHEIRQLRRRMGEIAAPVVSTLDDSPPGFEIPMDSSVTVSSAEFGQATSLDTPAVLAARTPGRLPLTPLAERRPELDEAPALIPVSKIRPRAAIAGALLVLGAGVAAVALSNRTSSSPAVSAEAPSPLTAEPSERPSGAAPVLAPVAPPSTPSSSEAPVPPPVSLRIVKRKAVVTAAAVPTRLAAPRSKPPTTLARDPYQGAR